MRMLIIAAAVAIVAPSSAAAQDAKSARAFLESIYRHYGSEGSGAPLNRPARFF